MSTAPMMSMSSGQEKEEPVSLSLWDEDSGLEKGGSMRSAMSTAPMMCSTSRELVSTRSAMSTAPMMSM
eukprot:4432965-Amphidinium_carterae.1